MFSSIHEKYESRGKGSVEGILCPLEASTYKDVGGTHEGTKSPSPCPVWPTPEVSGKGGPTITF